MDFCISKTNRGKDCLIAGNYIYSYFKQLKDGVKSWRCTVKNCNSYVHTDAESKHLIPVKIQHTHPANERSVERHKVRAAVKRKAVEDITQRPSKIIRAELQIQDCSAIQSKDLKSIAVSMYRERRKELPKLPKTRDEVQAALQNIDTRTCKGDVFLLYNDLDSGIVIFSCDANLKCLCDVTDLFVDGTFKCSPKHFVQMYSIHGYKNGHYVPLVFCLLPNKTSLTYSSMWTLIKNLCADRQLQLLPTNIHVDFEVTMHSAIENLFPTTTIKCCRFHLGQSWWRKIQSLGLSTEYKDRANVEGKWLKRCFGLHFLNPEDVEDAFIEDVMPDCPEKCVPFADYLVESYIDSSAKFPPRMWAGAPSDERRTNNGTESFHAHFNAQFYSAHPTIFTFVDVLKKVQSATYVKLRSLGNPAPSSKKEHEKIQILKTLYTQMQDEVISRLHYIQQVGYKYSVV